MGRVTKLTRDAQFATDALGMVNAYNTGASTTLDTSAEVDYPGLQGGNLWGSLSVKDLTGNPHKIFYATRDQQTKHSAHIEVLLLDRLKGYLENSDSGLTNFKVIIFIDQSPCTDCSEKMVTRCSEIAKLVVGGANIDFSFVYRKVYAHNVGDNRRINLHTSKDSAKSYYKNISGNYSWPDRSTTFSIRIRHLQNTKQAH